MDDLSLSPPVAPAPAGSALESRKIRRGSPLYARANWSLFAAGFATFSLLYCVQPLMPVFSRSFGVSPAESSLTVSSATAMLALSMPLAGALSEKLGRKGPISISLFVAALLCVAAAAAPSWSTLLVARTLEGLALCGIPAIAMAYLSEEIDQADLGAAMGLYIGGTAFGGMSGRLVSGIITDLTESWRVALAAIGLLGLVCAGLFTRFLPPSRHFPSARELNLKGLMDGFRRHLSDPGLRLLFCVGLLMMGCFVTALNYIGYRLSAGPYDLSQSSIGAIFTVYLIGIPSSALAGRFAGRFGYRAVLAVSIGALILGILITLSTCLVWIIIGLTIFSGGFFAAHTAGSSWVGVRAQGAKAQASALYLSAYYTGSSVVGTLGGHVWDRGHWPWIVGFVTILALIGLICAIRVPNRK